MTSAPFDTLKLATALREKAHFTPEQAEGMTKAFSEAFEEAVATKQDVGDLKHEIADVRAGLKHDIADVRKEMVMLEQRLTIKMGGMFIGAIAVLSGIMKLIHG
jgi:hypothetical protein